MKYSLLALCLALTLIFSGCQMLNHAYVNVTDHVASTPQAEKEPLTVEQYDELMAQLEALVEEGAEEAVLTVSGYEGELESDFNRAKDYVRRKGAVGAYLVEDIDKELVESGEYRNINLTIRYRRRFSELDQAPVVYGEAGVTSAIKQALHEDRERILLRVFSYEPMDFAKVVAEHSERNLTAVMAKPEVEPTVFLYKDSVYVELVFTYPRNSAELKAIQNLVDVIMNSAKEKASQSQNEAEKANILYHFLMERYSHYEVRDSEVPAFELLCGGFANSQSFSGVYNAMCEAAGLQCLVVHGTKNGEDYYWNILTLGEENWHVDAFADVLAGAELQILNDSEMVGYEWDRDNYPKCESVREQAPVDESTPDVQTPGPEEPSGNEPDAEDVPQPSVEQRSQEEGDFSS